MAIAQWCVAFVLSMLGVVDWAAAAAGEDSSVITPVSDARGRWGYIDQTGAVVIPMTYHGAGPFREGLAAVLQSGQYGYINSLGEWAVRVQFQDAESFQEGLALVTGTGGQRWFIDRTGGVVVRAPEGVTPDESFSEGLARARRTESYSCRRCDLQPDGRQVLYQGTCEKHTYGYVDRTGRLVIEPRFDAASSFCRGVAAVQVGERYGLIDRTGTFIIEAKYDHLAWMAPDPADDRSAPACDGADPLIPVKVGERYGFIDAAGREVIPPTFQ
jgi:hypothetical protein